MRRHDILPAALLLLLSSPLLAASSHEFQYWVPLSESGIPPEEYSFKPDEQRRQPKSSYFLDESLWVIDQQDVVSTRVTEISEWLDQKLAGHRTGQANTSFLRIGMANRWEKSGVLDWEPEIRFRLDLPAVKDRLNVIIESEIDEQKALGEQVRENTRLGNETTSQDTNVALRMLNTLTTHLRFSQDLGIKARIPPDPFYRARLRGEWDVGPVWTYNLDTSAYYFTSEGAGSQVNSIFSRPLLSHRFSSSSQVRWIGEDNTFEWAQVFSMSRYLGNRRLLIYRASVLGNSDLDWKTSDYVVDLKYRRRLYSNWLYYEIIPELLFPRDDGFEANPSLTLRIEMFFAPTERASW